MYAIGEERLWGRGYGTGAVRSALAAFLERRTKKVIARIYPENRWPVRSVSACGFLCAEESQRLHRYEFTMGAHLGN